MPAQALAPRTEDDERRLSTLSDGQLSRDGSLLTERLAKRFGAAMGGGVARALQSGTLQLR